MASKVDAVVNLGAEIPGYELLAKLGGGGMGEVYLARRTGALGFEKLVALKTVLPKYKKRSTVEVMFLDEARTAARLNHPTVPQVYDFGEAGRTFYLAMEYVAGVPFDAISEMLGDPWPPAIAAQAIAHVCRGLHSAHTLEDLSGRPMGIVHRDVSPNNLLLSFTGDVKLIDFGIALARGRLVHTTDRNEIRGKVRYMSPEQLQRKKLDFHADIFSTGVVLYELLVGPGATKELPLMGEAALDGCLEPVTNKNPYVLPELNDIIMRALRAKPSDRFENAKEMARALEEHAGNAELPDFAADILGPMHEEHQAWIRKLTDEDRADDLPERETVALPELPRRVTTSLHRLIDDEPDDTAEHQALAAPLGGHTAPRIHARKPAAEKFSELADDRGPLDDKAGERAGWDRPALRPLVLGAGGAGIAIAVALLVFAVLRSGPDSEPLAPSEAPPPVATEPQSQPQSKSVRTESQVQQQLRHMREKLDSTIAGRGLITGDDERLDDARLIFESAVIGEELERAKTAVQLAESAIAVIQIDKDFVMHKLARLRDAYNDVDDPVRLRRTNPLMKEIIETRRADDYLKMNMLMNQAFGIIYKRPGF